MLKYKIHLSSSQHVESLTSAADVFVLSTCLCLHAGSPTAPFPFPLCSPKSPDFGDCSRRRKMYGSGEAMVLVRQEAAALQGCLRCWGRVQRGTVGRAARFVDVLLETASFAFPPQLSPSSHPPPHPPPP